MKVYGQKPLTYALETVIYTPDILIHKALCTLLNHEISPDTEHWFCHLQTSSIL